MTLVRGKELPEEFTGGIVAIGNFDGVHRGHQAMLSALAGFAQSSGGPAVVVTFDPHPLELLRPDAAPPSLTTLSRKAELLTSHGVDVVLAYPADRALLALSPEAFFEQVVRDRLQARGMVEGPNFCFGKNRAGNVETLRRLCDENGMSCDIIVPVEEGGDLISSSKIREQIAAGRVDVAADWLGRPHRCTGVVVSGAGRGASIGFPTANLVDVETLIPADGVYAGFAIVDDACRPAAVNLGANPTFGEAQRKFEVHVLDCEDDLYGRELSVEFVARLREVTTFEDSKALKKQIDDDLKAVREVANRYSSR